MFEYGSIEYFIVDEKNTSVIDLVKLGINPKFDKSRDNFLDVLAVCDAMNLNFRKLSYTVPQRLTKVYNKQKSNYKVLHSGDDAAAFRDFFGNFQDENERFIPTAVGENDYSSILTIDAYTIKNGEAKFKVVIHNYKSNKTYETDYTGRKASMVSFFIPSLPIDFEGLTNQVIDILNQKPLGTWLLLSKKISLFTDNFKTNTGRDLFSNNIKGLHDSFARARTCHMLSFMFSCEKIIQGLNTTNPIKILKHFIKDAPNMQKFLEMLLVNSSQSKFVHVLQNLHSMNKESLEAKKQITKQKEDDDKPVITHYPAFTCREKDKAVDKKLKQKSARRKALAKKLL